MEFGVLGPLLVRDTAGGPLILASAKQRALLAALLLEAASGVIPAERLIDELWGEDPPATAGKALQVHVSQLRRALGPGQPVITRPTGYAIEIDRDALDLHRFEALLGQGRRLRGEGDGAASLRAFRAGLELWRGAALADVTLLGPGSNEADRLEGLRAVADEERMELELELGSAAALVPELEALVARDPYRERRHGLLMLALYRAGRQADALDAFRRARAALVEDLGLEPGPELVRLEAAILAQDPSLEPSLVGSLLVEPAAVGSRSVEAPAALASGPGGANGGAGGRPVVSSILGRTAELQAALELIDDPDVRLVTLTGAGGIGKTRLALELASRLGPRSCLVELAALSDPGRVIPGIGAAVGARGGSEEAVAAALAHGPAVLFLDNFEQVIGAAPSVATLLRSVPSLTVVVTSRGPLRLAGEHELALPPLPRDPAVELFVRRAVEHDSGFAPGRDELDRIAAICERIDGLPLAIELAAARTRVLTPAQILERIGQRLALLTTGRRDAPERHRTLRATITWSHDLLDPDGQQLFAQLAVFHSGWTVEASEAVADGPVLDPLTALLDHALVTRAGHRFAMLETVREYAIELLEASPEAPAVAERHALWYLDLARSAEPELAGPEQTPWFARLADEPENLRAACAWAVAAGKPEVALELFGTLWRFWLARGGDPEIRALMAAALASGRGEPAARVKALNAAGILAGHAGDFQLAQPWFDEALELAAGLGDRRQVARTLGNLGVLAAFAEDLPTALTRYGEAADLWAELGDVRGQSMMCQNLGIVHEQMGHYDEAMPLLEQSVELARAVGDRMHIASTLISLGRLLQVHHPGERRVPALLHEGLELSVAVGERTQTVECLETVADLACLTGEPALGAVLIGAADAERGRAGLNHVSDEQALFEMTCRRLEQALGLEDYEREWEHGRRESLPAAVALALEFTARGRGD